MSGCGSFSIAGKNYWLSDVQLYHDGENSGYELRLASESEKMTIDFSELLVGGRRTVGADEMNPKAENNSVWALEISTILGGLTTEYIDLENPFKSGYLDCRAVEDDNIDFDLEMVTGDGIRHAAHYHGSYSSSASPTYSSPSARRTAASSCSAARRSNK